MTRRSSFLVAFMAALVLVAALTLTKPTVPAQGKQRPVVECTAPLNLDCGVSVLVGKKVFYQLTDEEGGKDFNEFGQLEPFGRKVPAWITGIQVVRNPDGSLFFDENGKLNFLRDERGTVVVCLLIGRPPNKGGSFDKCDVPLGGREAGQADTIQPGDLRGL